jgi:S-adenosylmethionine synthetase
MHTSEWVSLGHPDKMADFISEYILDKHLEKDPQTRYAVEVQIKDNHVSLAGEVTTKANFSHEDIEGFVRTAVNIIGYTPEYQKKFGMHNTICGDVLNVDSYIYSQSPDIAVGVNRDAWGDQGIFFGYYNGQTVDGMGWDYGLAKEIGMRLYEEALRPESPLGLDIKTQVTVDGNEIEQVIVAVPSVPGNTEYTKIVRKIIRKVCNVLPPKKIIINGTGEYHIHGPVGDCGTTGRKLVVDFYGGNSRIGGGSPWTKDGSKADLTLNIFARDCAETYFHDISRATRVEWVETELSCCIGKQDITCTCKAFSSDGMLISKHENRAKIKPSDLIKIYKLDKPIYSELCAKGIFTAIEHKIDL